MNRKLLLLIVISYLLVMALVSGTTSPQYSFPNKGSITQTERVHNLDSGINYTTIQEAIDADETLDGHTIFVEEGIYNEDVTVDKTVSVIGEDIDDTIINGDFILRANNITLTKLTIYGTVYLNYWELPWYPQSPKIYNGKIIRNKIIGAYWGICLYNTDNNTIVNNTITNCGTAIKSWLSPPDYNGSSNYNNISRNTIAFNSAGIYLSNSSHSLIEENTISNTRYNGIHIEALYPPPPIEHNNTIVNNTITDNGGGVCIHHWSEGNLISENTITGNDVGLQSDGARAIILDNFVKNNIIGILGWGYMRRNKMSNNLYNFRGGGDVDTSNTVDGKSIYCLVNKSNLILDEFTTPSIGYVSLSSCVNITVRNLTLAKNGIGISVSNSNFTVIESNDIENSVIGIRCEGGYSNTISSNSIRNNVHGISLLWSENNSIDSNIIRDNTFDRFPLSFYACVNLFLYPHVYEVRTTCGLLICADDNIISNNIVEGNDNGIFLKYSSFNVLRDNNMADNQHNFGNDWATPYPPTGRFEGFNNDIDTSNTVDGKPIYYWINEHNKQIPKDAGYVMLVNSTNITIKNLVLENNFQGIFLVATNNTSICNNTIRNTVYGISTKCYVYFDEDHKRYYIASYNNTVEQNNLIHNIYGVHLWSYSSKVLKNVFSENLCGIYAWWRQNEIYENILTNNTWLPEYDYLGDIVGPLSCLPQGGYGFIIGGDGNIIHDNTVKYNDYGIAIDVLYGHGVLDNRVYHNNFINNTNNVYRTDDCNFSRNYWDDGAEGNYWSDYNERYPHAEELDGSGIWETHMSLMKIMLIDIRL